MNASHGETSEDLLARCRAGEGSAFEEVYVLMGSKLYGIALRMLGRPEEAEDAVQEVFVRLVTKARSLQEGGSLPAWLRRVTVNYCLDRLKSKGWFTDELPAELPARATGPRDTRLDLGRAISSLPHRARLVLVLHDVEGYKHREVADLLGISVGTSKAQLFRARRALRRDLVPSWSDAR